MQEDQCQVKHFFTGDQKVLLGLEAAINGKYPTVTEMARLQKKRLQR